jgi:hypothetical protein
MVLERFENRREMAMSRIIVLFTALALGGCGVETASTAASAAAIKKQELEQGKRTMDQAQRKIDQSMQQLQQRAADGGEAK